MAIPKLSVAITAELPTDLDRLDDVLAGLKTLADAHDVPWNKVRVFASKAGPGAKTRIDAYWTTPARV